MAAPKSPARTKPVHLNESKLPRLPKHARVEKRPLLRPQIASRYASRKTPKVVYIGSKTPFMAAVKRVRKLLQQAEKRTMQGKLSLSDEERNVRKRPSKGSDAKNEEEEILLHATGKAIEKAMNLALFFQQQNDCIVRIRTGSVDAIDDILQVPEVVEKNEQHADISKDGNLSDHQPPDEILLERNSEDSERVPITSEEQAHMKESKDAKDGKRSHAERPTTNANQPDLDDLPETRIRTTGLLEVAIRLR